MFESLKGPVNNAIVLMTSVRLKLKVCDKFGNFSFIIRNQDSSQIHSSEYCSPGSSVSCIHDFETRIVIGDRVMLKAQCVSIQLITPKIRACTLP
jgi:hypothetical protein